MTNATTISIDGFNADKANCLARCNADSASGVGGVEIKVVADFSGAIESRSKKLATNRNSSMRASIWIPFQAKEW